MIKTSWTFYVTLEIQHFKHMKNQHEGKRDFGAIRKRAEEIAQEDARAFPEDLESLTTEEAAGILHELRVQKIQLEMQNEALRDSEAELESSKARYFDLYDLAPVGYITASNEGVVFEANLTVASLLGRSRSALIRQPLSRFIHPEDQDIFQVSISQLFQTGSPQNCELRMKKGPGNSSFWVLMEKGLTTNKDGIPVASIIISDITRRKLAEHALQESEKKFRMMAENMEEVFYLLSPNARQLIYVNPAFKRLFGRSPDKLYGSIFEFLDFVYPGDRKKVREHILKFGEGEYTDLQFRIVRPDGEVRWLHNRPYPVYAPDGDGQIFNIAGLSSDITERKRTEKFIQDSLTEKQKLFSEVHSRVANNMKVIVSMLALQSEFAGQQNEKTKLLEDTQNRIKSMTLVHELIYENKEFSRINAGELIGRIVRQLKKDKLKTECKISFKAGCEEIFLEMDKSMPLSLLANELITNACRHAFSGQNQGQINVVFEKNNDECRLLVQDNGIGVQDHDLLDNPKSFGLYLVQELAKQLHGELAFQTGEKGLGIEVRFPHSANSAKNKASDRSIETAERHR